MRPTFWLNGRAWRVVRVGPNDPALFDRTGKQAVATTDPRTGMVRISRDLHGDFLARVLVHEVAHCALVSFGMMDELHEWCAPGREVEAEEWACNLLADYGLTVLRAAYAAIGPLAWDYLPAEFERVARAR